MRVLAVATSWTTFFWIGAISRNEELHEVKPVYPKGAMLCKTEMLGSVKNKVSYDLISSQASV